MTIERLHTDYFTICFDNGYWDKNLLILISQGNVRVVIPYKTDVRRNNEQIKNNKQSGKRKEIEAKKKAEKNKGKPKRIQKHEFPYIGKEYAFQCPKTKELLAMVGIVEISGELKKKYQTDYCLKCEFKKKTAHHNIAEYSMNHIIHILKKSDNYTIQMKVKKSII